MGETEITKDTTVNTPSEIECGICGAFFIQTNKLQKYCPDCRKSSGSKMRKMERNYSRSVRTYGTGRPVRECRNTCKQCGKEFISYKYEKDFCSRDCRVRYTLENTACVNCGKTMAGLGFTKIPYPIREKWLCSDECAEEWQWKIARQNGTVHTCPVCGKEYIKDTKYCCRECYLKDVRSKSKQEEPKKIMYYCGYCRKAFEVGTGDGTFCSPKCREAARLRTIKNEERQEKRRQEKKEAKEAKYIRENGLCSVCRTSYRDCERMQTNFRMSPKGTVFDGALVVKCPKFTDKKPTKKKAG